MKVHELITELQKHSPRMEVQIQVNEREYLKAQTVKTNYLHDDSCEFDDDECLKEYVVIQYE